MTTANILCYMKNFKFLRIFGVLQLRWPILPTWIVPLLRWLIWRIIEWGLWWKVLICWLVSIFPRMPPRCFTYIPLLYMSCNPRNDGKLSIRCSSVQMWHMEMSFNGNSLWGCLVLHLGQKILIAAHSSSCLLLDCKEYSWEPIYPNISFLKLSNRFPNSTLVTPLELGMFPLTFLL